jgi:hypothetical protein
MYEGQATVPCKYCGKPTPMLGTRMCDAHWELERRIRMEPEMAARMLAEMRRPQSADLSDVAPHRLAEALSDLSDAAQPPKEN